MQQNARPWMNPETRVDATLCRPHSESGARTHELPCGCRDGCLRRLWRGCWRLRWEWEGYRRRLRHGLSRCAGSGACVPKRKTEQDEQGGDNGEDTVSDRHDVCLLRLCEVSIADQRFETELPHPKPGARRCGASALTPIGPSARSSSLCPFFVVRSRVARAVPVRIVRIA